MISIIFYMTILHDILPEDYVYVILLNDYICFLYYFIWLRFFLWYFYSYVFYDIFMPTFSILYLCLRFLWYLYDYFLRYCYDYVFYELFYDYVFYVIFIIMFFALLYTNTILENHMKLLVLTSFHLSHQFHLVAWTNMVLCLPS